MTAWEYDVDGPGTGAGAYGPFVDGAVVTGTGPRRTLGPAELTEAGPAEVERAVAAARAAQPAWAAADRARALHRAARGVEARATELAAVETLVTGRPVGTVDVPGVVAHLRSAAGWADKLDHTGLGTAPRGVVGGVAGTLRAAAHAAVAALACGNAVVLAGPPSAVVLAEAAGLPAGVLNVLPGATLPDLDAVAPPFPDGPGVHVVHDDAPLDQAVDGVVETLGTDRRVLVAESVAEELGALLTDRLARTGDPAPPLLTFRTPAEAVALAGRVDTAAVWTDKGSRGLWTARNLRAAVVWVNAVDRWDPAVPAAALAPYLR